MFLAGAGFLLVGLGFKVSLVPFHMWTPDVYEGAPTSVTAFMSVAVKAAGFSILIRIVVLSLQPLVADWSRIFWCLAVATMVLGNVVALVQENIKRMLAYSSIAHAGYVLVALTPGTETGVKAALIYLFIYFLMNLDAGLARKHPVYGLVMAVFMFSLAGVPPTGGFIGKFYAFSAAVQAGYIWLAVIGVLMSAVSAYFYLRVLVVMYMHEPVAQAEAPELRFADLPGAAFGLSISLLVCTVAVLALGVWPGPLTQIAQKAINGLLPSL
jgi:NADH-quinone oxidoreductase subunit N